MIAGGRMTVIWQGIYGVVIDDKLLFDFLSHGLVLMGYVTSGKLLGELTRIIFVSR